jgi:branched-chain amino acid transport system substrate-binding protein
VLRRSIYRSHVGAVRFKPDTLSAYHFPADTRDPSLGMPHLFSQIIDKTKDGVLIAPAPYDVATFVKPSWMS